MKKIALSLVVAFSALSGAAQIQDNRELKEISFAFERDHSSWRIDRNMVRQRDDFRKRKVLALLKSIESPTSNDYAHAATVFDQISDSASNAKMLELMTKSVELDPTQDKSLLAIAIDRQLVQSNRPQIYGTQSYLSTYDDETFGLFVMYEVDTTQVSDAQRKECGVRTLEEERAYLKYLVERPLSDLKHEGKSVSEIIKFCKKEFKKNPDSKYVREYQLYKFGSKLTRDGHLEDALKIFELSAKLYPNSFNTLDVLGECYYKLDMYKKGTAAFKQSLRLNPNKDFARNQIAEHQNR